ncbi:MAG: ABC transporter permease [Oceanicaulis sp.]
MNTRPTRPPESKQSQSNEAAHAARLFLALVRREVEGRYRGSALGIGWSMITPLIMLGIYTFVFGVIFRSRWVTSDADASPAEFAVILFIGLILFQVLAEIITRSPGLMVANTSYVKKVVFPLYILVPIILGSALTHAGISLLILVPFLFIVFDGIPWTAIFLPLSVAPLCLMALGVGWFLASIGTFARDISQVVTSLTTAMLFLAPIFFPLSALPVWLQPWIRFNPLTVPVNEARKALVFGVPPDFMALFTYTCVALAVCTAGYVWFQKTRKGFADVL